MAETETPVLNAVRERPIIFGAESVRAILDGRKTQTRRADAMRGADRVYWHSGMTHGWGKKPPEPYEGWVAQVRQLNGLLLPLRCPYGQPGDRLWVREAHGIMLTVKRGDLVEKPYYKADTKRVPKDHKGNPLHWQSPIHMSRWASRITLEVTGVRVERLQEITDTGGMREGWQCDGDNLDYLPRMWYRDHWDLLNAKRGYGWEMNPWVWVVEFAKVAA